jgi:hypothetical protein
MTSSAQNLREINRQNFSRGSLSITICVVIFALRVALVSGLMVFLGTLFRISDQVASFDALGALRPPEVHLRAMENTKRVVTSSFLPFGSKACKACFERVTLSVRQA